MPLMHCMECHHEWESTTGKSLCDWCGAGGYTLKKTTEFEEMIVAIKDEKTREMLLGDLTGKFVSPRFEQPPSFVEIPADRTGRKKNEI